MRTTLKRGIGRAAAANGNGRAVLPPGYLSPVTHYRQSPPRRRFVHTLAKAFVWLLIVALTVAAGLVGGAWLWLDQRVAHGLTAHSKDVKEAAEALDAVPAGEPAIALAIGYDRRLGSEGEVNGARSDSVMLLRADPLTDTVSMLSFPRDLLVEIHCPGKPPFQSRINEAYSECGARGTLETVRRLTGLPINYLITVNFHGFKQMVAKLGGVWIDVDRRYFNDNSQGGERYATINLQPGYQKLQGADALDFVRYRHFDSDLYRLARQQLFVQAFKQAITSEFSASDLPKTVGVIRENVEIGSPGDEELDPETLIRYGLFLYERPAVFQTKIDFSCIGEDDVAAITVDVSCIRKAVDEFANPDPEAPEKATAAALGRKLKSAAPPPAQTTVVVLNGNGVPGAAADTSYQLAQRGYRTLEPPNGARADAPSYDYLRSKVYYDATRDQAPAAATKMAELLGEADVEPMPSQIVPLGGEAMLVTVVGQSFGGTIAPAPVDRTPERRPPAVEKNRDATLPLLREAQKKVPFPLMVPTLLESSSSPLSDTPIRIYKIAGHPTVRLTFGTGLSEYWGIQMVRWNGAPALRSPSRKLYLKGRVYELHYHGAKLHMVVLRERGTTYWVVNTLLNTLSNETMLAIARGLQPLK